MSVGQNQGFQNFKSTVNGAVFSVRLDEQHTLNFINSAQNQNIIVPEQQVQYDTTRKATSGLGEIEIVDTPKESQPKPKTTRTTRKAAGAVKAPRATSPKKKGDDVKVEIES